MQIAPESSQAQFFIKQFENNQFTINQQSYLHNIIIQLNTIIPWDTTTIEQLSEKDIHLLIDNKPELVLLGVGNKMHYPKSEWLAKFYEANIGIEIMNTTSACRTYNVLAGDNRQVVAGLII